MKNEPAFPVPSELCQGLTVEQRRGMTLRDYFAAKALSFVLERWTKDAVNDGEPSLLECDGMPTDLAISVAEEVYAMADAMLKVREKCTS